MFWIDASHDYLTAPQVCPACGQVHSDFHDVNDMAEFATMRALRHAFPELAQKEVNLWGSEVGFIDAEVEAALALIEDALSLVPEVRSIIEPFLVEDMRADQLYDAFARAGSYWRQKSFTKGTASKFEEAMVLAVATGVTNVNSAVTVDRIFRQRIIDGMVRSAKYYTNEYFNRQVMPALITSVEKALSGDQAGAKAGYMMVRGVLDTRLKSVPYWHTVASAAASRSYHYGMLRAGDALGKTTYRFVAVMDERTTEICRSLHLKEWAIYDAIDLIERIAAAEDPEEVKTISPWLKPADIAGKNDREIRDMGIFVPPLHAKCRSTIEVF